jgi:hypothetical protein
MYLKYLYRVLVLFIWVFEMRVRVQLLCRQHFIDEHWEAAQLVYSQGHQLLSLPNCSAGRMWLGEIEDSRRQHRYSDTVDSAVRYVDLDFVTWRFSRHI